MKEIVVVEDSADQREVLADVLSAPDVEVRTFADPVLAFAELVRRPPSLVLLDWYLPRLPGAAFVRNLRADPSTRHLPVVVLTGALAIDATGVDAVLVKPVDVDELLSVTGRLMAAPRSPPGARLPAVVPPP